MMFYVAVELTRSLAVVLFDLSVSQGSKLKSCCLAAGTRLQSGTIVLSL